MAKRTSDADRLNRAVERQEHAHAMHKRAVTRIRRAKSIELKWRRRVRYIDKLVTALRSNRPQDIPAGPEPPEPRDPDLEAFELEG